MDNSWLKLDIFTTSAGIEPVCAALLNLRINGFQITDPNDLDDFLNRNTGYWDYYDESILRLRDAEAAVTVYIDGSCKSGGKLLEIKDALSRLKKMDEAREWGRLEYAASSVFEKDWASNWKKYYHPIKIGERLVVCPSWESYEPFKNEIVIKLDPGMAFGTGTHESTMLCLRLTEAYMPKNAHVLDLGCGSGILSIAAVLLGAASSQGVDIDETAVRVANENAALNGVSKKCKFSKRHLEDMINGRCELVLANITADVITQWMHHIASNVSEHGVLIISGVIDERGDEVMAAVNSAGFSLLKREEQNGWVAMAFKRVKD
ncbi:MAG: 50S ribosomal protein L11 methyltransferase [Oscillospiraceae bacterium]|nr:50S ribosomal protein L11 methyltransferase [Oscillospiraceae bacterium]